MDNNLYNNIDEQSREAVNNVRIEFDEQAWQKMEALLSKSGNNKAGFWSFSWKKWAIFSTVLLLLSQLGWLYYNKSGKNSKTANKTNFNKFYDYKSMNNNILDTLSNINNKKGNLNKGSSQTANQSTGIGGNFTAEKLPLNLPILNRSETANTMKSHKLISIKNLNKANKYIIINNLNEFLGETLLQNGGDLLDVQSLKNSYNTTASKHLVENKQWQISEIKHQPNFKNKILVENIDKQYFNDVYLNKKIRLFLSTSVMAEANTVKFKHKSTWQINDNWTIGAYFGKKLSIDLSVGNSIKIYKANKSDYNPNGSWYYRSFDTLSIHANCRFIEIPINLKYYFNGNQQNTAFVGIGTTFSKLKRESYQYDYYEYGLPKRRLREWSRDSSFQMNAINLTVGYNHYLNSKVSLFGAALVKLPTIGVGFGQVKFTSYGLQTGVIYMPFKRKKLRI